MNHRWYDTQSEEDTPGVGYVGHSGPNSTGNDLTEGNEEGAGNEQGPLIDKRLDHSLGAQASTSDGRRGQLGDVQGCDDSGATYTYTQNNSPRDDLSH